ncbi:hypothetical protein GR160_03005 [Flavobacterium sp. Sd200]|uniref:hypothetical protein n=1 Tax=Flavobacterium sp. Sd200 TaxID=2692211 RepID=UPI0013707411|nr:hypothetical protein [Flavobacterium sp. Sd200]MXN90183.1 hypothetical protein [Flavobacterium sp. Sd200]
MLKTNLTPAGGCMPPAGTVPTLLQKPIAKLNKMRCVAGVSSGSLQPNMAMVHISFSNQKKTNPKKALDCFKRAGVVPKLLHINRIGQFMQIWLQPAKTLTH